MSDDEINKATQILQQQGIPVNDYTIRAYWLGRERGLEEATELLRSIKEQIEESTHAPSQGH